MPVEKRNLSQIYLEDGIAAQFLELLGDQDDPATFGNQMECVRRLSGIYNRTIRHHRMLAAIESDEELQRDFEEIKRAIALASEGVIVKSAFLGTPSNPHGDHKAAARLLEAYDSAKWSNRTRVDHSLEGRVVHQISNGAQAWLESVEDRREAIPVESVEVGEGEK